MVAEQLHQGKFIPIVPKEAAVGRILFPTPAWNRR
jgi:hypothetical protein